MKTVIINGEEFLAIGTLLKEKRSNRLVKVKMHKSNRFTFIPDERLVEGIVAYLHQIGPNNNYDLVKQSSLPDWF